MDVSQSNRSISVSRALSTVGALYAIVAGIVTLLGWALQIRRLTDWKNDGLSMFPNTAVCAVLSGAAILLIQRKQPRLRRMAAALAALVALIGGLTLFQHITNINLGIDTLLFDRPWALSSVVARLRMGPPASAAFLAIGLAIILANAPGKIAGLSSALGVAVIAVSLLSLTGYLYGARQMYTIPRLTAVAFQTATVIVALGLALITALTDREPMRIVLEDSAAGGLARRALPIILVGAISLGWLRLVLQDHHLVDLQFGTALRTLLEIALLVGLLWWSVLMIRRHEQSLRHHEQELLRQAELLRKAKEEAEAANRAKDKFLAALSHELRTPLTPVVMTATAMAMNHALPEEIRNDIALIRQNVELEARLIDDLLDLSRVTAGKLRLNLQRVGLQNALHTVCEIHRHRILEKGIRLLCEIPQAPLYVNADPARLQQILWNLLGNSVKFTPENGQVTIRVETLESDRLRILFQDTGIGIPADILPRIFDAFEQGDSRVTQQFGGMGMGLAITKALIELHQGVISARSDGRGQGATFAIDLPALPAPEVPQTPAPQMPSTDSDPAPPLRVLVVEDHEHTARVLTRLLSLSGHQVKSASTVASALSLAEAEPFDVVVSDIGLPDATGYELMAAIKQRYNIKGIAMSGYGMEEDLRKSREAGFSDHIVKPADVAHLERTIRRVVASSSVG